MARRPQLPVHGQPRLYLAAGFHDMTIPQGCRPVMRRTLRRAGCRPCQWDLARRGLSQSATPDWL
jgi:hypothetical protein